VETPSLIEKCSTSGRCGDELIAARAFHAVNAEISATDSHGVLGRPRWAGLYFVVTRRWRGSTARGYRRSQIHVA